MLSTRHFFGYLGLGVVLLLFIARLSHATTNNQQTKGTQGMTITKLSPYSVSDTIDKLDALLTSKGLTVFARVNHGAGAKKVDMDIGDSELIIFGNPQMGTPLMIENPLMGLELPLKILAYSDKQGQTHITYIAPETLKQRNNLASNDAIIEKMTAALDAITSAVIQ